MKKKYIYITNKEWFENTALKNPIAFLDTKLESVYPEFCNIYYDLKLLVTTPASDVEKDMPFYNDYREKYGSYDISVMEIEASQSKGKNVLLNGFTQEHLQYIAPYIKDSVEVLYLFKCPKISDLSVLSEFNKLRSVFIYCNNSITHLWDMSNNIELKIISFVSITKLSDISRLVNSNVEYINFDSADNSGIKKEALFDATVINEIPNLKHLKLVFSDLNMDY